MKRSCGLILSLLIASLAFAADFTWPDLPDDGFIAGRAATEDDVANGQAVFVLKRGDVPIGKPIEMPVPQYALHIQGPSGIKEAVIIVQAESNELRSVIGYLIVGTSDYGVGFGEEFEFLGTEDPGCHSDLYFCKDSRSSE
jgi:hypothetical protein